jgi:hypothetical protein
MARLGLPAEIALALAVKLAALTFLYFAFFAHAAPVDTAARIVGP